MNNPLEKLLKWRLNNIIEQFNIDIYNFSLGSPYQKRKNEWNILNQKLVSHGYITLEESNIYGCYYVIKNIVWKNIINYELTQNKCHMHMLWIKYNAIYPILSTKGYLYHNIILNIDTNNSTESKQNLDKLYSTIIDYMLLLNRIIRHNLIIDLANILNMYIFDIILIR